VNSLAGHRSVRALVLGAVMCVAAGAGTLGIAQEAPTASGGTRHVTKAPHGIDAARACASASGKTIGGATLTTAVMPAGQDHPKYCRIGGHLAPSLNYELRLPDAWNGKLYYEGVGGYGGYMPDVAGVPLMRGYAEVASDTGHQGDGMSAAFALDDVFAAQQFGSLAVPTVMASVSKVLAALYGTALSKAYFEGCSTGGGEALMAVQRNPGLFDGVIARAPAFNWVGLTGPTAELRNYLLHRASYSRRRNQCWWRSTSGQSATRWMASWMAWCRTLVPAPERSRISIHCVAQTGAIPATIACRTLSWQCLIRGRAMHRLPTGSIAAEATT
jgi:Tannase and feruloyl esterase